MSVEIQTMGEGGIFEIAAVVIDEVLEIQPFTDVEYKILSSARDILAEGSILEAATVATNSANTAAGLASEAASAANDAAGLANSATTSANTAAGAANTAASSANSAASAANTAAATAASFVGTGPAGYYATLTALQEAYPTGDTGIYVELEYGHWYYWSGSAWIDGGLFQAPLAVVQTTGTSETDVMSQKAVTDELALKAAHGYASNPKTLKQVDDSLVQLAGELNYSNAVIDNPSSFTIDFDNLSISTSYKDVYVLTKKQFFNIKKKSCSIPVLEGYPDILKGVVYDPASELLECHIITQIRAGSIAGKILLFFISAINGGCIYDASLSGATIVKNGKSRVFLYTEELINGVVAPIDTRVKDNTISFRTNPLDVSKRFNLITGSSPKLFIPDVYYQYGNTYGILESETIDLTSVGLQQILFEKSTERITSIALNAEYDISTHILCGYAYPDVNSLAIGADYNINGKIPNNNIFSILSDTPAVTNTLAMIDDEEIPLYKDSIFKSLTGGRKTNVILETTTESGRFKRYEIHNPTYLKASQIGASAKLVIETELGTKIYKDITKIYKGHTTGHGGSTLNLMTIGDSLTQGNGSVLYSPLALIKERFSAYGITVNSCGTFDQADGRTPVGVYISEGRGFWNYKTFVGKDSSPYGQPVTISTGTGLTTKFENPFLRLATETDKTDHPDWCFTNAVANPSDPDGVSYATNSTYTNYYIFDFAYYLTQHSVTVPDVITIALGINDWQEAGVINVDDEYLSMQIMYNQIRSALPNVPIMLIPTNGVFPGNQTQWEQEMFPLLERIITYCETQQVTDGNLHLCPIYQHVARYNAYKTESGTSNIGTYNNIKQATMADVHVLDKETSRKEYMDAYEATLLSLISE